MTFYFNYRKSWRKWRMNQWSDLAKRYSLLLSVKIEVLWFLILSFRFITTQKFHLFSLWFFVVLSYFHLLWWLDEQLETTIPIYCGIIFFIELFCHVLVMFLSSKLWFCDGMKIFLTKLCFYSSKMSSIFLSSVLIK